MVEGIPKPTVVAYRINDKYPWLIKQGHNEVKLTHSQAFDLIQALMDSDNVGSM